MSVFQRMKRGFKICENCEKKELVNQIRCSNCGHSIFRPGFVEKRRKITKNFSVNVVPSFNDPSKKVLTLYKWFPGKDPWYVNITSSMEWEAIKKIINDELGPLIGWQTKESINQILGNAIKTISSDKSSIKTINREFAKIIKGIIKRLDFKKIDEKNHKYIMEILGSIAQVITKSDEAFQVSFKNIIKQLPKQEKIALDQLDDLLRDWTLKQITGVTQIVRERLNEILRFESAADKDKTYEIKGDNSIHRILERAMWIVDERYWLLHSNETLRKIVGDQIVKEYKNNERLRPDFVCGSIGNKLIIVELKRPSHKLTTKDLGQLEQYLKIIESHTTEYKNFEAYLVGKTIEEDLNRTMRYRRTDILKIRTFADIIDDTKKRYKDYLDKIKTQS